MDTESTEQLLRIATKLRDAEKQLMDQCQKLTHQARNFAQRLALRSKPEKSWPPQQSERRTGSSRNKA